MCGGSNSAAREAQQQEQERQRQVQLSTRAIDQAYKGREGQYGDFLDALRSKYMDDAGRQKAIADRNLKFSLARSGNTGGSVAADQNTQLGEEYTQGVLKAENTAQSNLSDLIGADEASRAQLISMAQGGADASTAAARAASALGANISSAKSGGLAADIGDIFTQTANTYNRSEEAAARRQGYAASGDLYSNPFSR